MSIATQMRRFAHEPWVQKYQWPPRPIPTNNRDAIRWSTFWQVAMLGATVLVSESLEPVLRFLRVDDALSHQISTCVYWGGLALVLLVSEPKLIRGEIIASPEGVHKRLRRLWIVHPGLIALYQFSAGFGIAWWLGL